jgi:hypothetical protein
MVENRKQVSVMSEISELSWGIEELKNYYLELIEATPLRDIDDDKPCAYAKLATYKHFVAQLDDLMKERAGDVLKERCATARDETTVLNAQRTPSDYNPSVNPNKKNSGEI